MLKINLLPPYYRQRRLVRRAIVGVILAAIAISGGFLYWNAMLGKQAQDIQAKIDQLMPEKNETERLQAVAVAVKAQINPIQEKTKFCNDVIGLPEQWIAILENVSRYTPANISLRSMTISGSSLRMQGDAADMRMAARYYLNALRNDQWVDVTINTPGAYPSAGAEPGMHPRFGPVNYPLDINVTLAHTVTMPGVAAARPPVAPPM